jgi:2'-5' RNA ligase
MGDNFFLAILPPPERLQALCDLRDRYCHGKSQDAARLHITMYLLHPLIEDMGGAVARLRSLLNSNRLPACSVLFDEIVGGKGVMLLRGAEIPPSIMALRHRLLELLRQSGIPQIPDYNFHPHITLQRGRVERGRWAVDPVGWPVDEIVLVRSYVGQSRYETLDRWELERK